MEKHIYTELLNQIILKISGAEKGHDEIIIELENGEKYKFYHEQRCCEIVKIADIDGDIQNLIGSPLLQAEAIIYDDETPDTVKVQKDLLSWTWAFYKFATIKGYVTIRWYGDSNGCYSERVDFVEYNESTGEWE
ncbi:MAG: hypothetical protein ABIA63_02115 [bacterium]